MKTSVEKCTKCGGDNDRDYHAWCGDCYRAYRRQRYWNNPIKYRAEATKARSKKCRDLPG